MEYYTMALKMSEVTFVIGIFKEALFVKLLTV